MLRLRDSEPRGSDPLLSPIFRPTEPFERLRCASRTSNRGSEGGTRLFASDERGSDPLASLFGSRAPPSDGGGSLSDSDDPPSEGVARYLVADRSGSPGCMAA